MQLFRERYRLIEFDGKKAHGILADRITCIHIVNLKHEGWIGDNAGVVIACFKIGNLCLHTFDGWICLQHFGNVLVKRKRGLRRSVRNRAAGHRTGRHKEQNSRENQIQFYHNFSILILF